MTDDFITKFTDDSGAVQQPEQNQEQVVAEQFFGGFPNDLTKSERLAVYYLVEARIAAGLENKENGASEYQANVRTMGDVWTDAAGYIDELAA